MGAGPGQQHIRRLTVEFSFNAIGRSPGGQFDCGERAATGTHDQRPGFDHAYVGSGQQ